MEFNDHGQLILASASPRRKELLRLLGIPYRVIPALGEEQAVSALPWETVERLSAQKACEVARRYPDCRVLGADTVVAFGEEIFGKPADEQDAYRMLRRLQGNTHQVYTGVTLFKINRDGKEEARTFHEKTDVEVYPMSDREIWAYIRTGEPMDKAGAYGIQGSFCLYVKGIRGDYQNVVGLPVSRLYDEMKKLGLIEGYACSECVETYSGLLF